MKYPALSLALLMLLTPAILAQQSNSENADQIEQFALELVSTKSEVERNLLLAARKELITPDLRKELVKHGNLVLAAGQYASALSIYSMVQDISKRIDDKEGSATASLNIGTVNYFQGHYAAAIDQYAKARELFLASGNRAEAAKALFGLGLAYQEKRDVSAALEAFTQALTEYRSLEDKDEIANTLTAIGSLQYSRGEYAAAAKSFLDGEAMRGSSENLLHIADAFYMQGDYAQAIEYYEKGLTASRGNPAIMVSAWGSAANSYYYQGNYERALDYYQKALMINERLGDRSGAATQLQGIGNTHRARGDFGAALESYFKSLESAGKTGGRSSTAGTLGSIGLVRAMQGENAQAIEYFQKSLAEYETTGDKVGMARMLSHIGNVCFVQENFDQALDYYRKSLALRETMGDKNNSAHNLSGIGTTFLAQGDYAQALENYDKALLLYKATENKTAIAELLTKLSDAYLSKGDFEQALNLSLEAVTLARENESLRTLWYALTQAGNSQRLLNRTMEARRSLEQAIAVVESLRSQPPAGEPGYEKSAVLPYHKLLEIEINENRAAEAFQLAERAKVISLKEIIGRSRAQNTKGLAAEEREAEAGLTSKLVSLGAQLEKEEEKGKSPSLLANLKNQRGAVQLNYQTLMRKLYATHQEFRVNRGEFVPVGFDQAGDLLNDDGTALLEFTVAGTNSYLFVLTGQRVAGKTRVNSSLVLKAYPLNVAAGDLSQRVASFNESLLKQDDLRKQSRDLYDLLLRPAEEQLAGKSSLIIVPDGALWHLPFEALQPADTQFLIEQKSVSYEISLSALRQMRERLKRRPGLSNSTVAVGNPLLTTEVSQRLQLTYGGEKIESWSFSGAELQKIKALDPRSVSVLTGQMATEDRVKSELSKHRLAYLAVPAALDDSSAMYSGAVLTAAGSDGFFNLGELLQQRSEAKVAILSGSKVIGRRPGYGQAAVATSWAWFVGGTPTVVLSRRRLESGSTEQLMIELLRRLRTSMGSVSAAAALRAGVLSLMRRDGNRHPFYWSGFMVLGETR